MAKIDCEDNDKPTDNKITSSSRVSFADVFYCSSKARCFRNHNFVKVGKR